MDRREFLTAAAIAATAGAAEATPAPAASAGHASPEAIEELSLADIAAAFADGRIDALERKQLRRELRELIRAAEIILAKLDDGDRA